MSLVGADRSLERDETALRALCSLRLSPMENGMLRVSGQLDPEAGAVLTAALDPLTAPRPCTPTPAAADPWATNTDRSNPADGNTNNANGNTNNGKPGTGRDLRPARPAPRRSPHRDLPPRRRSRRIRPSHHQSQCRRHY
jgi:Domain of unknown function (DUF222)